MIPANNKFIHFESVPPGAPNGAAAGLSAQLCGWELRRDPARTIDENIRWNKYHSK